jgi:hypothetical protein
VAQRYLIDEESQSGEVKLNVHRVKPIEAVVGEKGLTPAWAGYNKHKIWSICANNINKIRRFLGSILYVTSEVTAKRI